MQDFIDKVYTDYYGSLYRMAYSILKDSYGAEDAVNTAFLKLISEEKSITDVENIKAYMMAAVKNASLDMLKKNSRIEYSDFNVENEYVKENPYYYESREDDKIDYVKEKIKLLKKTYVDIMYMYIIMGMSAQEISVIMGLNIETVKKRIQRGKKALLLICNKGLTD